LFGFLIAWRGIVVLFQLGLRIACEKCCFLWEFLSGVIGIEIDGLTFSRSGVVVLAEMELVNFD